LLTAPVRRPTGLTAAISLAIIDGMENGTRQARHSGAPSRRSKELDRVLERGASKGECGRKDVVWAREIRTPDTDRELDPVDEAASGGGALAGG